jgi:hypothetical protein
MKARIVRTLLVLTLVFTWLGFHARPAYAVGCHGSGCTGLNPSTMGCGTDAVRSGSRKILNDGGNNQSYVETRKSAACDAKWARAYNISGGNRYAAASIRYGCANYCYNQSVSTSGLIASSATVGIYTPMVGLVPTPTRSCGRVSTSGPIAIPLAVSDGQCTGVN